MIQRRQFIGSLAAVCTLPVTAGKVLAANLDRNLQWQCQIIQTLPHDYGTKAPVVTGVSLQPGGEQVAIVGDDHYVCVFDTKRKVYLAHLGDHTDWVRTTKYSPNGQLLASAGNDRKLRLWNSDDLKARPTVFGYKYAIIDVDFSSDSNRLATVGFHHELRIYDLKTGAVERRLLCECPDNHAVAFSDDDTLIAAGGRSGIIRVWDSKTGEQINQFQAHKRRIRSIQFTDDNRIVSCGDDQLVKISNSIAADKSITLPRHSAKLFSAEILKDDLLATAGSDNLIHIWRMRDSAEIGTLKGHTGTVSNLDYSANKLASGSYDTQVRVWKYDDSVAVNGRQTNLFQPQNLQFK